MSKIDLTAAELREFVRLWRTEPRTRAETSALRKLERRIPTFLPTTLALALADAMEERDKALADLEAAREAIKKLSWERCHDCDGGGILGTCRDGRRQSCESCGGSEDSRGDGWLPNHDNIAETMESTAVRAALEGK